MAQKIIPKSFRLNYFKNWESSSIVSNENYSNLFFFEYNVSRYLKTLCIKKQIILNKIKIKKQINSVKIYVSLYRQTVRTKTLDKLTKQGSRIDLMDLVNKKNKIENNLQKYCKSFGFGFDIQLLFFIPRLQKQKKRQYYNIKKHLKKQGLSRQSVYLYTPIFMAIYTQSVVFLNNFLIKNLKTTKKHVNYLRNFEKTFNFFFNKFPNFIGYKIQWKGRLNGKERAKKIVFKAGTIPLNTIRYDIKYDIQEITTPAGVCSLRTWLLFDNTKNVIPQKYKI